MEIKLEKLSIRNFKGLRTFDFEPNGNDVTINGANGSGKSTVYDAYCWMLFGTDSNGNSTFDIEPRDGNGAVIDPEAVTEVTGTFTADGDTVVLRKRCMQKWVRVRGRSELTYQGNTNEYEVNGVPCTKGEYEEKLGALCDAGLLKILSGVYAFPSLPWQEQREMLSELIGEEDDYAVMASAGGKYADLSRMMTEANSTLDDVVKMIERDRKLAIQAQNALPAAIDENKRMLGGRDCPPLHNDDLKMQAAKIRHEIDAMNARRADVYSSAELIMARDSLAAAEADIAALKRENELYIREQRSLYATANSIAKLRREATDAEERRIACERRVNECKSEYEMLGEWLKNLRAKYDEVMKRPYNGEDTCPRCGRKYDDAMIAKARQLFEDNRNDALGNLAEEGKALKARHDAAQADLAEAFRRLKAAGDEETETSKKLEGFAPFEETDMPGYTEKLSSLEENRRKCEEELKYYLDSRHDLLHDIDAETDKKQKELSEINRRIGDDERYYTVLARIKELEGELKQKSELADRYDTLLALADDYGMYKARRIEDSINERFSTVRFKLFENQKNGGLRFCCEATVGGIGFNKNLNTSAKINAGIDIINAFSHRFNVTAPVFVDNAESVTDVLQAAGQMILLTVSADDNGLNVVA